jgi:hypothetical protein
MGIGNTLGETFNKWMGGSKDTNFEKLRVENFNLHIPKTAGSSLSGYLTQKYSAHIGNMVVFHGPQYFTTKRLANVKKTLAKSKGRIYSYGVGHVPFSIAKELFEISSICSVVRHPIDRWLSNFFYSGILGDKSIKTDQDVKETIDRINLTRAREEQIPIDVTDNIMVRMLCDDYLFPNEEIDYKNFESAFRNLGKVQIINMSELDEIFYNKIHENSKEGNVLRVNINQQNSYADLITDELLELAESMNAFDLQLWNLIETNKLCLSSQKNLIFNTFENEFVRSIDHVDYEGGVKREEYEIYPDGRPEFRGKRH